jgi:PAS domain S-box-containing protein
MQPKHSHAALSAIVDIAADGIIALDDNFRIIRYNQGAEQIFGWTEAEMLGQPLDRLLPMSARAAHRGHLRSFAEGTAEARRMGERRGIAGLRRSGEEFPAEASISRAVVDGERTYMVMLRDISERKRAEERQRMLATAGWVLAASLDVDSTLATITEIPLPVLGEWSLLELVTPEGTMRRVAASHSDPLRTEPSLLATHVNTLPMSSPTAASGAQVMHDGEPQRITDIASWKANNFPEPRDRQLVDAVGAGAVLLVPLRTRGRAIGALHIVRTNPDAVYTTDEVHVAEQFAGLAALALENARLYQESKQAVREREELLAIVSHDLRNPVNAIRMLTGALLGGDATDGDVTVERDQLQSIRSAARQADDLIQDLQDVTRISASRLRVETNAEDLDSILVEASDVFDHAMKDAQLEFNRIVEPDLPMVEADRPRVLQVLSNLLGNAIRYTPPGGEVQLTARRESNGFVRVEVRDTGPGVSAEDVPRLFERYWQAPRLLRAGSGLGLYIAKGIVEAHGGVIGVESDVGEGSRFWFTHRTAS